jgi:ElaB/YqjD/DUF883 family membrane-anchored ribosome-binding protein
MCAGFPARVQNLNSSERHAKGSVKYPLSAPRHAIESLGFLHHATREKTSMNANSLSVITDPADVTKEQLIQDFKVVIADAEALIRATAGQGGEAVAAMRAKAEASLAIAKAKMNDAQAALRVRTRAAAKATDEYVHVHPWQAIGAGTAVGLLVGLLIGRR